jgi:hypothetical protein
MPDVTPAHREIAVHVWRQNRPDAVDRIAQAIANAELRGPAGGPNEPTEAEERGYAAGLQQGFHEAAAALAERGDTAAFEILRARAATWDVTIPPSTTGEDPAPR